MYRKMVIQSVSPILTIISFWAIFIYNLLPNQKYGINIAINATSYNPRDYLETWLHYFLSDKTHLT